MKGLVLFQVLTSLPVAVSDNRGKEPLSGVLGVSDCYSMCGIIPATATHAATVGHPKHSAQRPFFRLSDTATGSEVNTWNSNIRVRPLHRHINTVISLSIVPSKYRNYLILSPCLLNQVSQVNHVNQVNYVNQVNHINEVSQLSSRPQHYLRSPRSSP